MENTETKYNKAEERIKELEKKLETIQLIADSSYDWEIYRDDTGKLIYSNKAFERITGFSNNDFLSGKINLKDIIHPSDYDSAMLVFKQSLNEKTIVDYEFRIITKNKEVRNVSFCAQPVYKENKFAGFRASVRDITKFQIFKKLKESEAKLKAIIATMPDLLFHLDTNGKFLSLHQKNRALYKSPKKFLGKTIYDIFEPEKAKVFQIAINKAFEQGKSELKYELSINEPEYYHAKFSKLNENEIITVIRDITKETNTEFQLKKYLQELEIANKDKDRFMQIIAHDLKSPFNSLIGFSELLLKNIDNYDKKRIEKFLKIISQTSNSTYKLLEDLLTWSKSQSKQLSFEPQKINFENICQEIIEESENRANEKDIKVIYTMVQKIDLHADLNMLKTILRNLISNAIKFSHNKGLINIYTEQENNKAIITVSDNGVGIAPNNQHKLWDFGNSFSTKGTNNEKGTGLGLVICKELVNKHNGEIWVESQINEGSDFKFTMPINN